MCFIHWQLLSSWPTQSGCVRRECIYLRARPGQVGVRGSHTGRVMRTDNYCDTMKQDLCPARECGENWRPSWWVRLMGGNERGWRLHGLLRRSPGYPTPQLGLIVQYFKHRPHSTKHYHICPHFQEILNNSVCVCVLRVQIFSYLFVQIYILSSCFPYCAVNHLQQSA